MHYSIIVLFIVFLKPCTNEILQNSGKYRKEFINTHECDDVGTHQILYNTRITKHTRDITCYEGYLVLGIPFNDDVQANYTINCMDFSDIQQSSARTLLYGTYRFTIHYFVKSTTKVGCITFVGNVLPREDRLKDAAVSKPEFFTT